VLFAFGFLRSCLNSWRVSGVGGNVICRLRLAVFVEFNS
jgi:hypothetical protein